MASEMYAIDRLGRLKNKLFALSFLEFQQAGSTPDGAAGLSYLIRDLAEEAESIEDDILRDDGNLENVPSR